jgi:hypothetical protein
VGHDTHFLARLDRVSDAHVERALTLYRDEALLKEVLNRAGLAEGVERLAISLDHPVDGPFVIVTREGRFVTCLGKGMRLSKSATHPILTRERLDAAAAKVERMREHLAEVERLKKSGAEGLAARLIRRLDADGLCFCREDAETLLGVLPLFPDWIFFALLDEVGWIMNHRHEVSRLHLERLKPRERDFVLRFRRAAERLANLLVLAEHDDVRAFMTTLPPTPDVDFDVRSLHAIAAFELGTFAHATRALWVIGRNPRAVLRDVKDTATDPMMQVRIGRETALGMVALTSNKLRAEALKAMFRLPPNAAAEPPSATMPREAALDRISEIVGMVVRQVVDRPEVFDKLALDQGRLAALSLQATLAGETVEQAAQRPGGVEALCAAVPEPVARAMLGVTMTSWLPEDTLRDHLPLLASTLPWIARAQPADFFLPRAYAQAYPRDALAEATGMIGPYAAASLLTRPKPRVRLVEKTGRNDPCWCGSGVKYKRCCGAARG